MAVPVSIPISLLAHLPHRPVRARMVLPDGTEIAMHWTTLSGLELPPPSSLPPDVRAGAGGEVMVELDGRPYIMLVLPSCAYLEPLPGPRERALEEWRGRIEAHRRLSPRRRTPLSSVPDNVLITELQRRGYRCERAVYALEEVRGVEGEEEEEEG